MKTITQAKIEIDALIRGFFEDPSREKSFAEFYKVNDSKIQSLAHEIIEKGDPLAHIERKNLKKTLREYLNYELKKAFEYSKIGYNNACSDFANRYKVDVFWNNWQRRMNVLPRKETDKGYYLQTHQCSNCDHIHWLKEGEELRECEVNYG